MRSLALRSAVLSLFVLLSCGSWLGCSNLTWQRVASTSLSIDTAVVTVAYAAIRVQGVATPDLCKPADVAEATEAFATFQIAAAQARAAIVANDEDATLTAMVNCAMATSTIVQIKARVCPYLHRDAKE